MSGQRPTVHIAYGTMNDNNITGQHYISQIIEESGTSTKRPLNVCLIGTVGAGKSSFINMVAAALNGIRWREHAAVGDYGGMRGVTTYIQRFPKCCQGDNPKYNDVSLPTLIDVPGFPQDEEPRRSTKEIFRLIFFGKIGHEDSLQEARDICWKISLNTLRRKCRETNRDERVNKIDRIIFVATAREMLPVDLIQCVVNAAQPSGSITDYFKRSIPIFGVLTHASPKENEKTEDLDKIAKRFRHALGINSHRLLKCSNYCDNINGGGCVTPILPELDIPVLEFLVQVFDPSLSVLHDDEMYFGEMDEMYNDEKHSPSFLGISPFYLEILTSVLTTLRSRAEFIIPMILIFVIGLQLAMNT